MALALIAAAVSCSKPVFTKQEKALINVEGNVMKVFTIAVPEDSLVLRQPCKNFSDAELKSETYKTLATKMIATVTDPQWDGVGIAGPQVGLSRRVVAVLRYDKPDTPFEVYPNIVLEPATEEKCVGREGCLSVPDFRGVVNRYTSVKITYTDPESLERVSEVIEGFTAVIFQHECDHLDGILYIDKLELL
ncbi:MAG: peptide deformylase [Bacteroidales bacterium]|nr:peptide deformylase [Bacteroidales bacterium]